jgi:hypothetical protein
VLSAGHCVRQNVTGPVLPAGAFTVSIGKSTARESGFSTRISSIVAMAGQVTAHGDITGDIALLHLASPAPSYLSPLPLRQTLGMVPDGSFVRDVGWGVTSAGDRTGATAGVSLNWTAPNTWFMIDTGCFSADEVCFNAPDSTDSYPAGGDSGSPWVKKVHGSWVHAGVFTGYSPIAGTDELFYGASALKYLSWVRSNTNGEI